MEKENKLLNNSLDNAERRRKRAEARGDLSVSHWRGELHSHTMTDRSRPALPEEVFENRKGSNCGRVPLGILVRYHAKEMKNEYLAITEHSRDASPEKALEGITNWFYGLYLNNPEWIKKTFKREKTELTEKEKVVIKARAREEAEKLTFYEDERIEEIFNDIDGLEKERTGGMRVLKGIEISILPDGSFDSEIIKNDRLEYVNCSIHPEIDPAGFKNISNDPEKYTDLVLKGIMSPRVNSIGHIGFNCPPNLPEALDWDRIALAAIDNKVSLEINLKEMMDFIYKEMLDYRKFPKNNKTNLEEFKKKLPELVPLLSSEKIRTALSKYFPQGLKIAINTDEHRNPFVRAEVAEKGITEEYLDRDFRFWRCLKEAEKYFNEIFKQSGVKQENIINTFSRQELERFILKSR